MKKLYIYLIFLSLSAGCNSDTSNNKPKELDKNAFSEPSLQIINDDKAEYIQKLIISAKDGDVIAQNELAGLYAFGEGVQKNGQMFEYWSELAASNGSSLAQLNLGAAYYAGTNGVNQDIAKAKKWLTLAADNGEAIAKDYLNRLNIKEIPDASIPDEIKILIKNNE